MKANTNSASLIKSCAALTALSLLMCAPPARAGEDLKVVGLDGAGTPYLISSQDSNHQWHSAGTVLPNPGVSFLQIAMGKGYKGNLEVVGIDMSGTPYLCSEDAGGHWSAGFKLPNPGVAIADMITVTGADGNLQVLGTDGHGDVYLVSWQDRHTGHWSSAYCGALYSQGSSSIQIGSIVAAKGFRSQLQVIGLDGMGTPHLISTQDTLGGWHVVDKVLPSPAAYFVMIIAVTGTDGNLQVVGLDNYGNPYLVSWQNARTGKWSANSTGKLLNNDVAYSYIAAGSLKGGELEVIGLDGMGTPHLISLQAANGTWLQYGNVLPNPGGSYSTITTALGADGNLQVLGLDEYCNTYLVSWQDRHTEEWSYSDPGILSNPNDAVQQIVTGYGD